MKIDILMVIAYSTQLNKPTRKVVHKRKEAHKSLIISPDSLDNSQVAF